MKNLYNDRWDVTRKLAAEVWDAILCLKMEYFKIYDKHLSETYLTLTKTMFENKRFLNRIIDKENRGDQRNLWIIQQFKLICLNS